MKTFNLNSKEWDGTRDREELALQRRVCRSADRR